jgi:hypothetical protein
MSINLKCTICSVDITFEDLSFGLFQKLKEKTAGGFSDV